MVTNDTSHLEEEKKAPPQVRRQRANLQSTRVQAPVGAKSEFKDDNESNFSNEKFVEDQPRASAQRRSYALRSRVEQNRKSKGFLSQKKALETCTICFDEIQVEVEARLDSCEHIYCKDCIDKWVDEVENSCPQCKQRVTKITTKDALGKNTERIVQSRTQVYDPFENLACQTCSGRVRGPELSAFRTAENQAVLCELCLQVALHHDCMTEEQRMMWEGSEVWLCTGCQIRFDDPANAEDRSIIRVRTQINVLRRRIESLNTMINELFATLRLPGFDLSNIDGIERNPRR